MVISFIEINFLSPLPAHSKHLYKPQKKQGLLSFPCNFNFLKQPTDFISMGCC